MAVQIESSGQLEEFLGVARRRLWWILLPAAICIAIGICFAVIVPKKYVATTRIMVRNTLAGSGGGDRPGSNSAREAQVAPHHIMSPARIAAVLEGLRWPEYLDLTVEEQQDYVLKCRDNLEVEVPTMPRDSESQVVIIEYANPEPDKAHDFLLTLKGKWQQEVLERGRISEKKSFDRLKETKASLEKEVEAITDELTAWRRDHQIAPTGLAQINSGPIPTYDTVFEQLQKDQSEFKNATERIEELRAVIADARQTYALMPEQIRRSDFEAGVDLSEPILDLRAQRDELRLTIEENHWKPKHSKRRKMEDEIRFLELQMRQLEDQETEAIERETWEPNQKRLDLGLVIQEDEAELQRLLKRKTMLIGSIKEQRDRANELQQAWAHIEDLEAERVRVNNALEQIELSYLNQKRTVDWIQGPGGNPFEILETVKEPTKPTEPNPALILAFSIFVGFSLGLALAVVAEYSKNCFRSVGDISRVMVVPVLGTVNAIVTRAEASRALVGRILVGGASLAFIGILAFVTWAWKANQQLLSPQVLDAIERFREQFI